MAAIINFGIELFLKIYGDIELKYDYSKDKVYPLLGSHKQASYILILYLCIIYFGPKLLIKPFKVTKLMLLYNATQIIANFYTVTIGIYYSYWQSDFNLKCQPINFNNDVRAKELIYITYLYFLLKILDLFDTVFFVLRKKTSHITFLHIYHHVVMYTSMYLSATYIPGGQYAFMAIINCIVHIFMYTYYLLSTYQDNIKWKKQLTQLQILQFILITIHSLTGLIAGCDYPKSVHFTVLTLNGFMIVLFLNFYYKCYLKKNEKFKF